MEPAEKLSLNRQAVLAVLKQIPGISSINGVKKLPPEIKMHHITFRRHRHWLIKNGYISRGLALNEKKRKIAQGLAAGKNITLLARENNVTRHTVYSVMEVLKKAGFTERFFSDMRKQRNSSVAVDKPSVFRSFSAEQKKAVFSLLNRHPEIFPTNAVRRLSKKGFKMSRTDFLDIKNELIRPPLPDLTEFPLLNNQALTGPATPEIIRVLWMNPGIHIKDAVKKLDKKGVRTKANTVRTVLNNLRKAGLLVVNPEQKSLSSLGSTAARIGRALRLADGTENLSQIARKNKVDFKSAHVILGKMGGRSKVNLTKWTREMPSSATSKKKKRFSKMHRRHLL